MTEESIFAAALEKAAGAERAAFLDEACGGNAALRRKLDRLLAAHDDAGSFLNEPLVSSPSPSHAQTNLYTPHEAGTPAAPESDDDLSFLARSSRPGALGRLGHYDVLEVLGRGGFGIVFRAFDDVLQRVVAVKVLSPQMAATSPARKRFLREARSSAAVRHENVVHIHAIEEQPLPYLVMEFIPGETLQQRLDRKGPLEVSEVLRIGRQIAEGLAAAHTNDLIHRDIKPSNVMIEGGPQQRVKITDFGLARTADDASISQSGVVAGTPMYMAPEQAKGESLDHRADLFSLGSVLYAMLTGRPPFRANNTVAVLKRVAEETARPIREIIPEVPQWMCRIVETLHAKNREERFPSARAVAEVLADCEAQLKAHKTVRNLAHIPASAPRPQPARRGALVAAVLLLGVVGLGAFAVLAAANGWWFAPIAKQELGNGPDPDTAGTSPGILPNSAEQAIPALLGNWKGDFTQKIVNGQPADKKLDCAIAIDPVAGRRFVRQRIQHGNTGDLQLMTFDVTTGTFRSWYFNAVGMTFGPSVGRWDAAARTLTWSNVTGSDTIGVKTIRFVDANTVTWDLTLRDKAGVILYEGGGRMTRTTEPIPIDETRTAGPVPPEMKILAHSLGEWRNEQTVSDAATPDIPKRESFRVKSVPIMGGRFIEETVTPEAAGASDYSLIGFDPAAQRYRRWFFSGDGSVTELAGTWDEAAKTLTLNTADNGVVVREVVRSDDLSEYRITFKNRGGTTVMEIAGISRRIGSTAPSVPPPNAAEVAALRDAVSARERSLDLMRKRFNAGVVGRADVLAEEVAVLEARIQLAEAERDAAAVAVHLEALVKIRQEERDLIEKLAKAGQVPADDLNKADARFAEAKARLAKAHAAAPTAKFPDAEVRRIAALPVAEQLEAIAAALRSRNPQFDGVLAPTLEGDAVIGLELSAANVRDLAPLQALPKLKRLKCIGLERNGALAELTALQGMPLELLDINNTQVADLTPLKGMPLTELYVQHTPVRDLAPLVGTKLLHLNASHTAVASLAPLKGMPLQSLYLDDAKVSDLTPLKGMPLRFINIRNLALDPKRDYDVLRGLTDLETINGMPAAEFFANPK